MRLWLHITLLFISQVSFAFQTDVNAFVYHRFGDDRYPSTNISLLNFEQHLAYIQSQGMEAITANQLKSYLKNSEEKAVMITVDDAYKSFYTNALPLLEKYQVRATLFVNTATVGASDFMTWEQIKDAEKRGVEIGNHSHSHAFFMNKDQPVKSFEEDLKQSESIFNTHLGKKPKAYAFPYGEWDEQLVNVLKANNYQVIFAQNSGVIDLHNLGMPLPRFPMNETYGKIEDFKSKMNMHGIRAFNVQKKDESTLSLQIEDESLKLDQMQCFIQGSECELSLNGQEVTASATNTIKKRRTLFTLTVPNQNGAWHWFSYLWLKPEIKE